LIFLGASLILEVDIMRDGMTQERLAVDQLDVGSAIASVVISGADLAVASSKVGATEIATSAVTAAKIGSGAVTQAKLGSAVVGGANIAAAGITAANIGSNAITADRIASNAVGTLEQTFIGTGSPPVYCSRMLHGSAAMTAATSLWVVFGDVFATDTPDVTTACNLAGDIDVFSVSNGSFLASGTNATVFYWTAIGSA
jgi:hypothetical protein